AAAKTAAVEIRVSRRLRNQCTEGSNRFGLGNIRFRVPIRNARIGTGFTARNHRGPCGQGDDICDGRRYIGESTDRTQSRRNPPAHGPQSPRKASKFRRSSPEETVMTACIVGWAHTPFGKLEGETVESLIVRVAQEALADAGVGARDVDEIVLGHFNAGFSAQDFTAALVLQTSPDLRFKRASRVENACATGSAAVHQGLKAIAAGAARIVLVVGAEQMTTTPAAELG